MPTRLVHELAEFRQRLLAVLLRRCFAPRAHDIAVSPASIRCRDEEEEEEEEEDDTNWVGKGGK